MTKIKNLKILPLLFLYIPVCHNTRVVFGTVTATDNVIFHKPVQYYLICLSMPLSALLIQVRWPVVV